MHRATRRFWNRFYELPPPIQKIAQENFAILKENPPTSLPAFQESWQAVVCQSRARSQGSWSRRWHRFRSGLDWHPRRIQTNDKSDGLTNHSSGWLIAPTQFKPWKNEKLFTNHIQGTVQGQEDRICSHSRY